MTRSLNTRSMPPSRNISMACSLLEAISTRYPRVSSKNLRTDNACSLSSTHKIVFLGLMDLPISFFRSCENATTRRRANAPVPNKNGQRARSIARRARVKMSEFQGRQLPSLDGNACTEYEEDCGVATGKSKRNRVDFFTRDPPQIGVALSFLPPRMLKPVESL